jgi:Leucine-rich repeat (LRR) protein
VHLYNNAIESLPVGVFEGFNGCQELLMYSNKLRNLPVGLFDDLVSPTFATMDLGNNSLESLPEDLFKNMVQLEKIELNRNKLEVLPAGLFNGLAKLKSVGLWDNPLSGLPNGIFDSVTGFLRWCFRLKLPGNPGQIIPLGGIEDSVFTGLDCANVFEYRDDAQVRPETSPYLEICESQN